MTMSADDLTAAGPQDLSDDQTLISLIRSLPADSRQRAAACEMLVTRYQPLVRSCARKYRGSPESPEELMQAGYVGLMKAISRFDPAAGDNLAAYALPCISGEMKRHFRDRRWQMRVRRPAQELVLQIRNSTGELAQELGHSPGDGDLATHLGVTPDDIAEARSADLSFHAWSLDAPAAEDSGCASLGELLGERLLGPDEQPESELAAIGES